MDLSFGESMASSGWKGGNTMSGRDGGRGGGVLSLKQRSVAVFYLPSQSQGPVVVGFLVLFCFF